MPQTIGASIRSKTQSAFADSAVIYKYSYIAKDEVMIFFLNLKVAKSGKLSYEG